MNNSYIDNIVSNTVKEIIDQILNQKGYPLYSGSVPMLKSEYGIEPMDLENCTSDAQTPEEGNSSMAYKYRERIEVTDNGKHVTKWACGNTREEVQRAIFDICTRYGKYGVTATQPTSGRRWNEFAREWFEVFKKPKLARKPKTLTTRTSFFYNHVVPAFGDKFIKDITTTNIQQVLNSKQKLSRSYMNDIMCYMRGVFNAAVRDGIIDRNPYDREIIYNPCTKVTKRDALSEEDQADIIQHIPTLKKPVDRLFLAFLMYTAMRPGEIYALKWSDIDFDRDLIHVMRGSSFNRGKILIGEDGETKTGWSGVRSIPLHEPLKALLLPMTKDTSYVMSRDLKKYEGEPFSEQAAKCQWKRIKQQINVHGMVPYEGRHTYATNLAHSGIEQATTIRILGHKDERMSNRVYVHTNDKHVQAATQAMNNYYSRLRSPRD